MRNLLFSITFIRVGYIILRATFAVVGVVAFFSYAFKGLEGTQLAMTYVMLVGMGFCLVLVGIYTLQLRSRIHEPENHLKTSDRSFQIKDDGEVVYNPYDIMRQFAGRREISESECNYYLNKYPRTKFKGPGWDKLRGKLLTLRQSAQKYTVDGNTVEWK